MTQTLFTGLLVPLLGVSALAHEPTLSVGDLNTARVIGELGEPLHTVHNVECRVVDMSFTRAKADEGRLAFRIVSVDGKAREGEHYMDIPRSLTDKKPETGARFRFWAYETIEASGYPVEAFEKIGKLPFATEGLHFRSKLVVLKPIGPE